MKYESEILYDLMKRDGLLNPSQDHLPYESELKEKYVNEVEGAYPKLNDYRAEWLNYNKCEYIPADFPSESQTNQTSGTFQNVIPFAYDVATLKGQTLVNIVNNGNWEETGTNLFSQNIRIKKGQIYTVMGKTEASDCILNSSTSENTPAFRICAGTNSNGTSLFFIQKSDKVFKATFTNNENDTIHLRYYNQKTNYKKLLIIEGDHTQEDIPYFEGMKSVQIPVLTTTGKNLFDDNTVFKKGYVNYMNGGITIASNVGDMITDYIPFSNTGEFTISYDGDRRVDMVCYDSNKNYINGVAGNGSVITITEKTAYIVVMVRNISNVKNKVQIEKGTQATSYEPYKSITASANITLRGVGDVRDELIAKTGEVKERIGEIVFDGSADEDWGVANEGDTINGFSIWKNIDNAHHKDLVCDKLSYFDYSDLKNGKTQFISCINQSRVIVVNIKGLTSFDEVKQWLSENPITVQYQLETPIIKTVELTIIDEDNTKCDLVPIMDTMHYQTSSDTIPPLADLTVCVEATTQNLASFVHLEGVEENE